MFLFWIADVSYQQTSSAKETLNFALRQMQTKILNFSVDYLTQGFSNTGPRTKIHKLICGILLRDPYNMSSLTLYIILSNKSNPRVFCGPRGFKWLGNTDLTTVES